jgi:rhodanese-related sulfurtransferase
VLACGGDVQTASLQTVDVQQVVELQKKAVVTIVDANNQKTRTEQGIIPGALLLTSATNYEPGKELPIVKDAKLVFYCANEKCRASTIAAERALHAGYTNVAVLPAGIAGWKAAHQKTAAPANNT